MDLEKASMNYLTEYIDKPNLKQAFIAGAEWQKAQTSEGNFIKPVVSVNGVAFHMADLIEFYSKSKFVFNSPIADVINAMLNER